MNDEVNTLKNRYAKAIEDGRRISVITSLPEWGWYVDNVITPTVESYTDRILTGQIASDKEDWVLRGIIQGLKLVVETTTTFQDNADKARKSAEQLQKDVENAV